MTSVTQSAVRSAQERRSEVQHYAAQIGVDESFISELVDNFYAKVRGHPLIGYLFNDTIGDNWDEHLATMKRFWSSVALNSGTYSGKPIPKHRAITSTKPWHFNIWLALFEETLDEIAPSPDAKEYFLVRAHRIADNLHFAMFGTIREPNQSKDPYHHIEHSGR